MKQIQNFVSHLLAIMLLSSFGLSLYGNTWVDELVCEYHRNPIGIDDLNPRLSWKLFSDNKNVLQTAYEIRIAESPSNLNRASKQIWNSGKIISDQSAHIKYDGPALKSMQRLYWQVRIWDNQNRVTKWSNPAFWEMGLLNNSEWTASWIMIENEKDIEGSKPAHYLRKEFPVSKKVSSARLYASALGVYEIYINGEKVGDEHFTPGWTSYNNHVQYQTYDVTSMLKQQNAVGAIVGDGWYRGRISYRRNTFLYGDKLALIAQIHINYSDGTSEVITTDDNWKATTGPIIYSDIYDGEYYDSRLEMTGWASPGFNDNNWGKSVKLNHSKDILVARQGLPIKAIEEIKPIKIIKTPSGETVYDMGQNMVGWVRLKVKGKNGDKITLKFAEVLDKEGNFYTENLRAAKATNYYILSSNEEEVYEPRFTFFGFRYVKVEGLTGTPLLENITGVVIHSEMEQTGDFTCSDPLINQLQKNIRWGQKGNFLDVPTDCPQRDEKLGWTGDIQVFCPTAAFNYNVAAFFKKWLRDLEADQLPNGSVTHVVPDVIFGNGTAAWADAAVVVPWQTYLAYGDIEILKQQYSSMAAWVGFMKMRAGDGYLWTGDTRYGDWLAYSTTRSDYPGATTDKDLISNAFFAYSSSLLSKIATILGKTDDAQKYATLSDNVKKTFRDEFVTPSGRLVSHTQTAYALALAFDLLPQEMIPKAADYLAKDVQLFKHLTTGFVGTPLLNKTLTAHGHEDLAFMLLTRKDYPSWLYPVTQGATTIWERWDGQKPDGTFQSAGMNSFNHYAYGAIGEWMYTHIAGIRLDPEKPGYKHFFLDPHPGGGLTNAEAHFKSIYGDIKSNWKIEKGEMIYEVAIPPNTTATVTLPAASLDKTLMNSSPVKDNISTGIIEDGNNLKLNLGSGHYRFTYPYK